MKLRPLLIVSALTALTLTACKKEEPAAAPPATEASKAVAPATTSNVVANAPAPVAKEPVAPASADGKKVYSPTEAKDHVDEVITVKGKVYGVYVSPKDDVFINVGAAHPNAPFVVVRFHSNEKITIDELKALDGKTVSFNGKIKEHNGKPEIILNEPDQIDTGEPKAAPKVEVPKVEAPAAEAPAAPAEPAK